MTINELLYARCLASVAPKENIKMGFKSSGTLDGFTKLEANRASKMANGRIMTAEEKRDKRRKNILMLLPLTCTELSNKLKINRDLVKRDLSAMITIGTVKAKREVINGLPRPVYYRRK